MRATASLPSSAAFSAPITAPSLHSRPNDVRRGSVPGVRRFGEDQRGRVELACQARQARGGPGAGMRDQRQAKVLDADVLMPKVVIAGGHVGDVVGIDGTPDRGHADRPTQDVVCVLGIVQDRETERPAGPSDAAGQITQRWHDCWPS